MPARAALFGALHGTSAGEFTDAQIVMSVLKGEA
jgi:hypothetical protein